jgi:signal transduction histidine kinase/CHASE3 domain sensor protein
MAHRSIGVLIALVAALVAVGIYMELLGRKAYDNNQRATDLLLSERTIYSLLIDMETGTRGYVITGDTQFLQPFNDAKGQLPALWSQLTTGIAQLDIDDPTAKVQLEARVTETMDDAEVWQSQWAEREIALRGSGRVAEAMADATNAQGKQLFDNVRESSRQLNASLNDYVRQFSTDLNNIRETELVMLAGLGLLAIVSGVLTLRVWGRESALQDQATHTIDTERRRLQAVIDNLPIGVRLLQAPDSRVILQNELAAELFPVDIWNSMTRSERIEYFKLSKPDGTLLSTAETPAARVSSEGRSVSEVEFTMVMPADPNKRKRHFMASAAPVRNEAGDITATVVVLQDVTRMREIDQRKDEFIATAAHELRNPLAALSGYNQLIQRLISRGAADPASIERNLGEMGRQIARMNNLVERLLDSSRIQLGRLILAPSKQDLVKIAQTVVKEAETTDGSSHVIKLTAPDELTGCWDPVRLEQVLTNLVSNALRHTLAKGTVEIRLQALEEDGGRQVKVEVIDEGPGIPPDQRPHLFDRYYQTSALTSGVLDNTEDAGRQVRPGAAAKKQGLGLGLYISRQIVKAHKGDIGIEANPEGGSIFWFALPRGEC